jgi:methylglutaconyl-CoA hydratase
MENYPTEEALSLRFLQYEVDGRLAYITLNRPAKRNALSANVVTEMKQAFEAAEADDEVKVIILRAG